MFRSNWCQSNHPCRLKVTAECAQSKPVSWMATVGPWRVDSSHIFPSLPEVAIVLARTRLISGYLCWIDSLLVVGTVKLAALLGVQYLPIFQDSACWQGAQVLYLAGLCDITGLDDRPCRLWQMSGHRSASCCLRSRLSFRRWAHRLLWGHKGQGQTGRAAS